jgi:hypothetical protein
MTSQSLIDELTKPEPKKLTNWFIKLPRETQVLLCDIRRKFAVDGWSCSAPVLLDRLRKQFDGMPADSKSLCKFLRGVSESFPDIEATDEPKKQAKRNRC